MEKQDRTRHDKAKKPPLTPRARELRHGDTLAERLAWNLLRNRQFFHHKFRRQLPLGSAIVDFCCLKLKLVIELDGAGHAFHSQIEKDQKRDHELERNGFRVLRFPNGIVLKSPTEFMNKVRGCISELEQARLEKFLRKAH
ncbi:MAG: endonuclease domain-containing protein [Terriglobia bacterium]